MKIGIITFHWGSNHGAVLQTYALSHYLSKKYDANVEIINYCPRALEIKAINLIRTCKISAFIRKIKELKKEKKIKPFRGKLNLSKRYYTYYELKEDASEYDILIAGSDQIWNPYFLKNGEGKVTPTYFLNFGKDNVKKISVSASFGCERYPLDCKRIVASYLEDFTEISVRENSGKLIIEDMGFNATVTADPTALLTPQDYIELFKSNSVNRKTISKMILRKQSKNTKTLIKTMLRKFQGYKIRNIEKVSIPEWLKAIKESEIVITNSFHCAMLCLKLHTSFFVVLEDGHESGMNDRFLTMLDAFNLNDRIVNSIEDVENMTLEIDFDNIDKLMLKYKQSLVDFLDRNIGMFSL